MVRRRVIMVRHAAVASTWRGVCYGRTDPPLTSTASEASEIVRSKLKRLGDPRFDAIWTSPSPRCHDLALALAGGDARRPSVHVEPRIAELHFGNWEGRRWDELHRSQPEALAGWAADVVNIAPPRGESAHALQLRVAEWLEQLVGGTHLWVAHAGAVRAAWVATGQATWPTALVTSVPHLSPLELEPSAR